MNKILYLSIAFFIAMTGFSEAATQKFVVTPGGSNEVKFISDATVESFEGVTSNIEGSLQLDPTDLSQNVSAAFVVQMKTLDTGNKIRNGHMLDNHLHPEKFPISSFTFKSIEGLPGNKLVDGEKIRFNISGEFLLHGVKRDVICDVTALWSSAKNQIEVETRFTVNLADYNIPRPGFLFYESSGRTENNY